MASYLDRTAIPCTDMKILVIEDSKFMQLALDRILRKHGYKVNSASDGGKSLQMERQSCPDAVLLDMMLPSMPGTSILRALKHTPPVASIPTVVLSGLSDRNRKR